MSTRRRTPGIYASETPRGPNGERLCRNCHKPLAKGQRHNCSLECSENWMIRTSPSHARYKVWERDKGVCAACGQDSVAGKSHRNGSPRQNRAHQTGDLWQADHIRPVIEEGGECGLENLRTLCTECHKKETALLAARNAEKKRQEAAQKRIDEAKGRGFEFTEAPQVGQKRTRQGLEQSSLFGEDLAQ